MLFLALIISFHVISQQQEKIDSLNRELNNAIEDTTKVNILLGLFWEYRRIDPDTALNYALQSLELSKKINYSFGIANSLFSISIIYKSRSDFKKAQEVLSESIYYYEKTGNSLGIASCQTEIGVIYNKQNNYQKALEYLQKAQNIFIESGNKIKLSRIYNILGGIYSSQKQFDKALEYHQRSLNINKETGFELGMSVNYNNIGNVYREIKLYQKAIDSFLQSLEIKKRINDKVGIASIYNNLGLSYFEQENIEKAIEYHFRALETFEQLGDKRGISMCFINLASDYLQFAQPEKAINYAKKGLEFAKKTNYKEAFKEAYYVLGEANAKMKQFKKAYKYYQLYTAYKDSLFDDKVIRLITEMESGFEMEKKEKEIAILNAEKQNQELKIQKQEAQRNLIAGLAVLILVVVLFLYAGYRSKQKINKQLRQINETKSRFFANISHEFRTPLTLLLGPLEKLMDHLKKEDKNLVRMMYRNATRLLFLNNQLLDLSKLESGNLKLEVVYASITEALKGMVMSFQSYAEHRKIDFQYHFPREALYTYFDRDKIEKIVYNLLSNAFKFTPETGKVTFSATVFTHQNKIQLPVKLKKLSGTFLDITIKDTGKGISKEHLLRIFDRFYQVDNALSRQHEGTGLGLTLTKELVEMHHGVISVDSEVDEGSTFTVILPLDKKAYSDDKIIPTEEKTSESFTKEISELSSYEKDSSYSDAAKPLSDKAEEIIQVLIVEDNEDMRNYISECMSDSSNIIKASDGAEGFETAIEKLPDLIITDLMMPGMDGMELCQKLKTDERTSHIPVIMLTALAEIEDKIKGLETGADDYIAKPFNRQELITRAQNLIGQRKKLRERFSREVKIQPKDITVTSADEKFLLKIISVVEDNLSDPDLNVEHLVTKANMSRSQLHRKIKALTDQTTTEFIRTIRLKRAAKLLEQHYGTIAETIYAVGFNSLSYFTKCFHKQFNMTPKEYIEKKENE
ncbi:MAG: tetratricopeptide repeat protein [Bacteroidetes bacterium]|nr:tetratricopeptide repeat protein [Bacteroidota bacterium]MBL7102833.1 tetratricopeptide repeat protein [Bacteroidales bacterium]